MIQEYNCFSTQETPFIALKVWHRKLWMSFLVVENLVNQDQFILRIDFIRNFDGVIDLNKTKFVIRKPKRKYATKPKKSLITRQELKTPKYLNLLVKLQGNEAAISSLRKKNFNKPSDKKQVCELPNPNKQSAAILGRSFSVTKGGFCVRVLMIILDTPITIQRGRKLGYALPMITRSEKTENNKNMFLSVPITRKKFVY